MPVSCLATVCDAGRTGNQHRITCTLRVYVIWQTARCQFRLQSPRDAPSLTAICRMVYTWQNLVVMKTPSSECQWCLKHYQVVCRVNSHTNLVCGRPCALINQIIRTVIFWKSTPQTGGRGYWQQLLIYQKRQLHIIYVAHHYLSLKGTTKA